MFRLFAFALALAACLPLRANEPGGFTPLVTTPVTSGTVSYRGKTCRYLDNGILRAIVSPVGNVLSIRYLKPGQPGTPSANGIEMVSQTGASTGGFGNHTEIYYYWYPDGTAGTAYQATTGDTDRLELVYDRPYTPAIHKLPMDVELHYALGRGETTLYIYAALEHPASYPQADLQFIQMIWPIAHDATNFLCENLYIDDTVKLGLSQNGTRLRRNGLEPNYADIKKAVTVPGLPGEINALTSGPFNGQLTGKYSYNIQYELYRAWGRASDVNDVGEWVVSASHEYGNNGPARREYVHGWGLLYHQPISNHYSNRTISIPANVAWTKIIGPWGLYFNGLPTGAESWTDARAQGDAETAAWPYAWVAHPAYQPQAQRATLSGRIVLTDPLRPAVSAAGAWVGLAAPDSGENSPDNWQFQSDRHQYWGRADAAGNFTLPDIQTTSTFGGDETYQLYVYSAGETPGTGAVGEFKLGTHTFTPGEVRSLGDIPLNVSHPGDSLVWEIGIPDRSAAEFRHGDEYATPGLWLAYDGEFSNPHHYDCDAGNWATGFNFSHTTDHVGSPPWKWNLDFQLPSVIPGTYWLAIAYASADSIQIVRVNDNTLATFTPPNARPGASSFLRQAVQTKYTHVRVPIPASKLRVGANTITLDHEVHTNLATAGFMYDYLSLQAPSPPVLPPGRDLEWIGGSAANSWDESAPNWRVDGTTAPPVTFVDGDRPIFRDSGSNSPAVALSGTLTPGRITFANSTTKSFTLGGTGDLTGPFELLKTGSGSLTISPFQQAVTASIVAGSPVATVTTTTGLSPGLAYAASSAANDFPDGTTILSVDSPTSITLSANAYFNRNNITLTFGTAHRFHGGTVIDAGTIVLANATANTHAFGSGAVTLNGGTITMWSNTGTTHRAPWDLVVPIGATGTLNAGSRVDLAGGLSGGGTLNLFSPYVRASLVGNGSGFTGILNVTTDADGGDWRLANETGYPQAAVNLGPRVTGYTVLTGNRTIPVGDLSGGPLSILKATDTTGSTGVTTWSVGSRGSDDAVFEGSIRDTSATSLCAIEKVGGGIWTLSGPLTHSGPTRVSAGTLRITGSSANSNFTLLPEAALGGGGSITGNLVAEPDAVLELGTTPLAIIGDVTLSDSLVIRAPADPGPGTHVVASVTGTITGLPAISLDCPAAPPYTATLATSGGPLALVLALEDADQDLIKDEWELAHYPTIATAGPLDDTDGDGYNTYVEFLNETSPVDPLALPPGQTLTIRTSDGTGFDGTLTEVSLAGTYDGGFVTIDSTNKRNFVRQDPAGPRHLMSVLKFDLSPLPAHPVASSSLALTVNGSTIGSRTRTLSIFEGDDALITPALRYDAANPFVHDDYVPEIDTDTDFANSSITPLLTYANATGAGTVETIGSTSASLRGAIQAALASDHVLTLLVHGGSTQYLTQGDEDASPANHPALTITTSGDPSPDHDADGMDDAWEAAHFSSLTRDGNGDRDADGTSDLAEHRLGLDPNSPSERFGATAAADGPGITLTWPSAPGIVFTVKRSTSLAPGSWDSVGTVTGGAGGHASFTEPRPPDRAFYRVEFTP